MIRLLKALGRKRRVVGALLVAVIILGAIFVWTVGGLLIAPANHPIGKPPADLPVQNVEFSSASGAKIHGWLITAPETNSIQSVVVLMHGIHADRTVMLARAELLYHAGYSVLLFDFQAHGESQGRVITVGYLESRDATAAVNFIRQKFSGEKIAVIGVSMGAAAALLADPPLPVDCLVLESCYPTIYQAVDNRVAQHLGVLSKIATPLLLWQLKPRLGFGPDALCPITKAAKITVPKFFISGTADRNTTEQESKDLYDAAAEPKQFWLVENAGHVDMLDFAHDEYQKRLLEFLGRYLH